jgi:hypothetical protein
MERTNRKGSNILRKRNGNGETINGNENEGALPTETKTVEEIPKKKIQNVSGSITRRGPCFL